MTYDMFFDDTPKDIIEYLRGIGRHKLVELALYIKIPIIYYANSISSWGLYVQKITAISVNH